MKQLRDIMERRVVTIGPNDTAAAAWTRMRRRDMRHLVVTGDGSIVGVISERDLGGRAGRELRRGRRVRQLMTPQVITASPDMTLKEAADLMRSRLIGSLPVVEDGKLVGIVTATDVFDALGLERKGQLSWAERQLLRPRSYRKPLGSTTVPRIRKEKRARRRPPKGPLVPFPETIPKELKVTLGRAPAPFKPVAIRGFDVEIAPEERERMRQLLGRKLGRFATWIERVTVRVLDVNGPKGGMDKGCRIKVVLRGMPTVVVEDQAEELADAFRVTLERTVRAVKKEIERRYELPRKRAARRALV